MPSWLTQRGMTLVLAILLPLLAPSSGRADVITVYQSNFDSLALGQTQSPGAAGQDGWTSVLAQLPGAYGEIENSIANTGQALHEATSALTSPSNRQTIDTRPTTPPDLASHPIVTLSVDFFAHSSDLAAVNNYTAFMSAMQGSGQVIGLHLGAGNGIAQKSATGVSVGLDAFNGSNNNFPVSLTVGQQLAWDTWHHASVTINQAADSYVAITVDGQTENLAGIELPRAFPGATRPSSIDDLLAQIIPSNLGGTQTSDDVYWDNLSLTASTAAIPEPSSLVLLGLTSAAAAGYAWRPRRKAAVSPPHALSEERRFNDGLLPERCRRPQVRFGPRRIGNHRVAGGPRLGGTGGVPLEVVSAGHPTAAALRFFRVQCLTSPTGGE
jgi:PEP-CTERM motif